MLLCDEKPQHKMDSIMKYNRDKAFDYIVIKAE